MNSCIFNTIIIAVLFCMAFLLYYTTSSTTLEGLCNDNIAWSHTYDESGCRGAGCTYCANGSCTAKTCSTGNPPADFVSKTFTRKPNTTRGPMFDTDYSDQSGASVKGPVIKPTTEFDVASAAYDTNRDSYRSAADRELSQDGQVSSLYDDQNGLSPFNMDSMYNTKDLTQQYSFLNSSFLYRPISTTNNEYLSEVYFENNPLELEQMCKGLDANTCGLTSSCIYTGKNQCLPGNKRGPFNSYSDINIDYYYYKGKCYGNCNRRTVSNDNTPTISTAPTGTPGVTPTGTPGGTTPTKPK